MARKSEDYFRSLLFARSGFLEKKRDCSQSAGIQIKLPYNYQHSAIAIKMGVWINLSYIGIFQQNSGTNIRVFCYSNCDQEYYVSY